MTNFTVFPAIDISHGSVVRLEQGRSDREIVYGNNPLEAAKRWIELGAKWLHIVNLDGAFGLQNSENFVAIKNAVAFARENYVSIQLGGGMRSLAQVESALQMGVERVILSTLAIEHPGELKKALDNFTAAHLMVAVDCMDKVVYSHGWRNKSAFGLVEFVQWLEQIGIRIILLTDIARDGTLQGINLPMLREVLSSSNLEVILGGGVAQLSDVQQAKAAGARGVVIGKAIYNGNIDLKLALAEEV
ncbi:MAG: 1-(5-phosphoribosyl)-5-[(5-phosphoribosylamino)methylideneamino]imidazole-4-carboxamide isomerase [Anaerolineales bacterium]